jgi:hypothetical protein
MELKEDYTCMHGFTVGSCYVLHMGPLVLQGRQNSLIKTDEKTSASSLVRQFSMYRRILDHCIGSLITRYPEEENRVPCLAEVKQIAEFQLITGWSGMQAFRFC